MLQEILIHLILLKGPGAPSLKQSIALIKEVDQRYQEELGIKLKLVKKSVIFRDPTRRCRKSIESSDILCRYALAQNFLLRRDWWEEKPLKVIIAPPAEVKGIKWTGGIANTCAYNNFQKTPAAFNFLMMKNSLDLDYSEHAKIVLEHEIAHVLCANHYTASFPPQTVMHPGALAYIDSVKPDRLRFAPFSIGEISAFIAKL